MKKFRLALVFGLLVVAFMVWQLSSEGQAEKVEKSPREDGRMHYLEP